MTLNADQEKAAEAFFQFLFSKDKEFSISGPAGTGKTFLMHHLLTVKLPEFYDMSKLTGEDPIEYEVVLAATTNKAAEVLTQATGINACTIHSHMNLRVQDNYKTGVSEIKRTSAWKVHTRQIIFIDEASMTDSQLYEFILAGTDNTCKIVYLGDHCQMAPVFEAISPVYKTRKYFASLAQPMRNAGQPSLVSLCSQLRDTVETLKFHPIADAPGVIDYVTADEAQRFLDTTFKAQDPDARILCYANTRVQEYNQYIRVLRGYPETFTVGEKLINNSGIALGKTLLRVEEEFEILKIMTAPYNVQIDPSDGNSVMEVYDVKMVSGSTNATLSATLPTNPERHKELMRHYARQKNWSYFYKLKNSFPDLRQRDAATVYKAQGSTYHTVFLDLTNIGKCTQNDQLARMLYVGASRATTKLVLFGTLPERLFQQAA